MVAWRWFLFLVTIKKFDWTLETTGINVRSSAAPEVNTMKLAGFLLLMAGWGIALVSVGLLPSAGARAAFVVAGVAVEFLGLALAVRSHLVLETERK